MASVSPSTNSIPDGTYTVVLSYQDTALDAPASANHTGVVLDSFPTLSSSSPSNNQTSVSTGAPIVLTFDKNVTESGTNTIQIKKVSDNSVVDSIPLNSTQITGSGTPTLTITPATTLPSGTALYVTVPSSGITDSHSAPFAGFTSNSTLQFTTASATVNAVPTNDPTSGTASTSSSSSASAATPDTGYGTPAKSGLILMVVFIGSLISTAIGLSILYRAKKYSH